ncbi:RNA polymerase sigma factor [Thalassotalea sp. 1_MG-2023]|uniref:RNA polymerase sigma factor n=1 Tax=Thalassotalea sp. 1_MG-2023 TaxID=3062680 RepID=UPI0026E35C16|nr:RNA polymerase sigma factor [Thalassotalea sp. 1_MG-2023]MDO6428462.1 RNA polymerase sigma factor [Thalassotalea sp. 1_MG-2023]
MTNTLRKIEQSTQDDQYKAQIKALYIDHYRRLIHHVMKKGLSHKEAEDIAQEAFVKLLGLEDKGICNYIQAYLYKIATNLSIDKLRRQTRSPVDVNDDLISHGVSHTSPERSLENQDSLALIKDSLRELPLKCRQAFVLYKIKGMEYREIAETMQVSESMVRKYVLQAVRSCYQHLTANS